MKLKRIIPGSNFYSLARHSTSASVEYTILEKFGRRSLQAFQEHRMNAVAIPHGVATTGILHEILKEWNHSQMYYMFWTYY